MMGVSMPLLGNRMSMLEILSMLEGGFISHSLQNVTKASQNMDTGKTFIQMSRIPNVLCYERNIGESFSMNQITT